MSRIGTEVDVSDLQPGDLVFFNTRRFAFSHVGIYLGDNRFVHAPRRGREVEIATLDSGFWQRRFNGADGEWPVCCRALFRRWVGDWPPAAPLVLPERRDSYRSLASPRRAAAATIAASLVRRAQSSALAPA